MEFGKHIGKGLWAFADKSLPVLYGVGFILLVIRVLPPEEYGLYVLVQTIFLILFTFAHSISLQPMLKFVAEGEHNERYITAGTLLHVLFFLATLTVLWLTREPFAKILNAEKLADMIFYVPLLVAASLARNVIMILLQAKFRIREIFWIDVVHYLGSLLLLALVADTLSSAEQVLQINVLTFFLSSVLALLMGRGLLKFSTRGIGQTFVTLWDFAKYSFASNAGYAATAQIDSFVLSWYYGPVAVATYNAAKVFYRAYDIVTQVIQTFVMPASSKFAADGNRTALRVMFEKAILFTSVVLIPCSLGLIILAPTIIDLFYGTKYDEAVGVLRILALASFAVPWLGTISSLMIGSGQLRLLFRMILIFLVVTIVGLLISVPLWNIQGAAWALVGSQWIMTIVLAVGLHRSGLVQVHLRGILSRWSDIVEFVQRKFGAR